MTKPKRILVVDDERYNRDLLDAMLESLGFRAELANDGAEALAKLGPGIDLVLLDIMMPGIDGFEVARRIRQHPQFGHIPIIMVTALESKEDRLRAVEAGANDFISKPIDRVELSVRMGSLLRIKEAQDIINQHRAELEITVDKRTKALRESEERFRAVFDTAQDSIFIKDTELKYTHVNPAMLRLLDMPIHDLVGKTDDEVLGGEVAKNIKNQEVRVLRGQSIEAEHTILVNRMPVTMSCVRVPLTGPGGVVIGVCGIARDVTQWKEREVQPIPTPDEFPSASMRATLQQVRLAAKTDSLVLFLGESGSGKDFLARYLHEHSKRIGGPFFSINCAALAPELAESELFGHEPGAFTGSRGRKRGLLELAEGGTLLLNEIGELTPQLQAKLLTFLDTQTLTRVGGEKSITVNARLVAATNRELEREVEAGSFRKDLYYRLNVFSIRVPPLRQRIDDLPILINDLLRTLAHKMGLLHIPQIVPDALGALADYHWPGNVRELRNVIERALILCRDNKITARDLGMSSEVLPLERGSGDLSFTIRVSEAESLVDSLQSAKKWMVEQGLQRSGGSVKGAASILGITRDQMKYLMKSLGVRRE